MQLKKVLFIAAVLTATLTNGAFAQNRNQSSPEDRAKKNTEEMVKALNLNKAQTEKVSAINLKYAKKMDELRKNSGDDREAMRAKMKPMNDEMEKEFQAVLTAEQFELYKKTMEEKRAQRSQGGGQRGQGN